MGWRHRCDEKNRSRGCLLCIRKEGRASIAFSPDGPFVVGGGVDHNAYLWDTTLEFFPPGDSFFPPTTNNRRSPVSPTLRASISSLTIPVQIQEPQLELRPVAVSRDPVVSGGRAHPQRLRSRAPSSLLRSRTVAKDRRYMLFYVTVTVLNVDLERNETPKSSVLCASRVAVSATFSALLAH
ncbi:hypothetical protein BV22DRAFT_902802 [Leucogyrophana mollusca]|uniref:Uncharacterized protein n=1 Tax=Leucogyrophana mollusca TaxID=85980 RepID=A0ACB8AYK0_9AGAM|nr:hypothetical protein BV22DRAFT_902802 [Leucogyrophana mollusca]